MQDKQTGLQAIQDLMTKYNLSISEIQAFIASKESQDKGSTIIRLFAYLGGVFVLGGISIYVSMNWEHMSSLLRVLVTLGSGFVAFVMALLILFDGRFEKLVTPLFIVAALLELGGLLVLLDEYFTPTGHWEPASMLIHACVGIQFGLAYAALKRDALLFVTIYSAFMLAGSWFEYMKVDEELIAIFLGVGLVATSFTLRFTKHISITPIWYFVGGILLLLGIFVKCVDKSGMDIFYIMANLGLVYLSIYVVSRTLLFVSLLSLFCYISYVAYEHFVDSVGLPLVLIALGLLLFGLSAVGVKLNQKYLKQ